jgi:hypothetical protein
MRPRQRHPTARRPLGTRSLRRDSRSTRGAEVCPHTNPHPEQPRYCDAASVRIARTCLEPEDGGLPCRCHGWPIAPEPAGPGRASHIGETAARLFANAEGPRCGSRSSGRGRRSLQAATVAPAKKNSRHAMTREREPPTRGARRKASTDWEKHRALHPWRTKKRSDTVEEKKSLQGREASRRRSEPEARRNAGLGGEGSERLRDQHRGPLPPRLLAISAVGVMRR